MNILAFSTTDFDEPFMLMVFWIPQWSPMSLPWFHTSVSWHMRFMCNMSYAWPSVVSVLMDVSTIKCSTCSYHEHVHNHWESIGKPWNHWDPHMTTIYQIPPTLEPLGEHWGNHCLTMSVLSTVRHGSSHDFIPDPTGSSCGVTAKENTVWVGGLFT